MPPMLLLNEQPEPLQKAQPKLVNRAMTRVAFFMASGCHVASTMNDTGSVILVTLPGYSRSVRLNGLLPMPREASHTISSRGGTELLHWPSRLVTIGGVHGFAGTDGRTT